MHEVRSGNASTSCNSKTNLTCCTSPLCLLQVLLRWSVQKGFVPLPKSVSPERQAENAAVFGWQLSDADVALLDGWETGTSIMGAKLN